MVIVIGPAFSQKLLVFISVYNLMFCSSFHGRPTPSFCYRYTTGFTSSFVIVWTTFQFSSST